MWDLRRRDIADIDRRMLELLSKRSALLVKEGSWRKSARKTRTDPALEKSLWQTWSAAGRDLGLDPDLLRKFFALAGCFGHESARPERRAAGPYVLKPRRAPADLRLPGPRALRASRMCLALAAAAGRPLRLDPIVLNDPLVELIKALNQAGAGLSWKGQTALSAAGPGLDFDAKLIFSGDDPLNLYLLTALALAGAGTCKLTGGPSLKLMDLAAVSEVLVRLGARLAALNPHTPGLPARLEFGADKEPEVRLGPDTPLDLGPALALAAWSYPAGLALIFDPQGPHREALAEAVLALNLCGVECVLQPGRCAVPPARPAVPARIDPPLDPALCAYLLALPAFARGRAALTGRWDPNLPLSRAVASGLNGLGLDLKITDSEVSSKARDLPKEAEISFGVRPETFPLALALCLAVAARGGRARAAAPGDVQARDLGLEMLERLGADFETSEGLVVVRPSKLSWQDSWASPGPFFSLALALISYLGPGIAIDNPHGLTSYWPGFWPLYNSLPTGLPRPRQQQEAAGHDPKPGRRVRVRKD
ncbi:MAG: chorismate mutase [Desulfovibrionaceae bacterium]|nr:chorismate mutase [Desulfovibrionaceae bacterium]